MEEISHGFSIPLFREGIVMDSTLEKCLQDGRSLFTLLIWGAISLAAVDAAEPIGIDGSSGFPTLGSIERLDGRLNALLPAEAQIEKLAEGFEWAEGPAWNRDTKSIVFSDIPRNSVFKWSERGGLELFLKPSGYTGSSSRGGESGSNGLAYAPNGLLTLCMHGDRRVAQLQADGSFKSLAEYYRYRRFNSPNDLVFHSNGDLYFTDPPYGLEGNVNDPNKELLYQGVYLRRTDGEVVLLTDKMTRPNGIGFSPDEKTLYVANSDPALAHWMAYDVLDDGTIANGRVLFDATHFVASRKGLPDGLKVDQSGFIWATGPGGVLVLTPTGEHLGTIRPGEATANCGFGDDGTVLYLTSDMYFCRIRTTSKGLGF